MFLSKFMRNRVSWQIGYIARHVVGTRSRRIVRRGFRFLAFVFCKGYAPTTTLRRTNLIAAGSNKTVLSSFRNTRRTTYYYFSFSLVNEAGFWLVPGRARTLFFVALLSFACYWVGWPFMAIAEIVMAWAGSQFFEYIRSHFLPNHHRIGLPSII